MAFFLWPAPSNKSSMSFRTGSALPVMQPGRTSDWKTARMVDPCTCLIRRVKNFTPNHVVKPYPQSKIEDISTADNSSHDFPWIFGFPLSSLKMVSGIISEFFWSTCVGISPRCPWVWIDRINTIGLGEKTDPVSAIKGETKSDFYDHMEICTKTYTVVNSV